MLQGTYDITVVSRDTWSGAAFTVTVNGSPLNLTGASILMQARAGRALPAVFEASTAGASIVIDTPLAGQFHCAPKVVSAVPGVYFHDIQITLASGQIKTYIKGTFTVLEDYSNAG